MKRNKTTTTQFTISKKELKEIIVNYLIEIGEIKSYNLDKTLIEDVKRIESEPYMNTDSIDYEYFDGIKLTIKE